jgi:hypothetical protein
VVGKIDVDPSALTFSNVTPRSIGGLTLEAACGSSTSDALLREPEITDPSGFPKLDEAAIKAAKAMRYAAAVEDGAALAESCIKFKVKFARFEH